MAEINRGHFSCNNFYLQSSGDVVIEYLARRDFDWFFARIFITRDSMRCFGLTQSSDQIGEWHSDRAELKCDGQTKGRKAHNFFARGERPHLNSFEFMIVATHFGAAIKRNDVVAANIIDIKCTAAGILAVESNYSASQRFDDIGQGRLLDDESMVTNLAPSREVELHRSRRIRNGIVLSNALSEKQRARQ